MPLDNASVRTTSTTRPTSGQPAHRTVTVRAGDTLTAIAQRHNTTVDAIAARNPHINNRDLIFPGQVVALPPADAAGAAPAAAANGPDAQPGATPAPAPAETQRSARTRSSAAEQAAAARLGLRGASAPGTPTPGTVPGTRLEAYVLAGNLLKEGARGPEVVDAQRFMGMKTVEQDGVLGRETLARIKSFQRNNGLTPDGVIGPRTLAAFKQVGRVSDDARSLDAHMAAGAVLKEGDRGDHIRALKRSLGIKESGQPDVFDSATRAAVESFQRKNMGMKASSPGYGTVGPTTAKALDAAAASATQEAAGTGPVAISARGQEQMRRLVDHARSHNQGASRGRCFEYVWRYMSSSGYGKIDNYNDLPRMPSGLARDFSDYLNASPAHMREAGLQRLDTALSPPIRNPHDPRIPAGAVIVVSAGSTGTAHPTAGDIVVRGSRAGEFINDGPAMYYGSPSSWSGRVLGVYVPE